MLFNTRVTKGNLSIWSENMSKIHGSTEENRNKTAAIDPTIRNAGYINAEIYLFLIWLMYSYSSASSWRTTSRLPVLSHVLIIALSHSSKYSVKRPIEYEKLLDKINEFRN